MERGTWKTAWTTAHRRDAGATGTAEGVKGNVAVAQVFRPRASNVFGMIDEELLKILACPACHEALRVEGDRLVCEGCGRRYPIRDDIPIMLLEEAENPLGSPEPNAGGSAE